MIAEGQRSLLEISESLPFCDGLKNLSNYCFELPTKSQAKPSSLSSGIIKGALFFPENDQEAAKLYFWCSTLLLLRFVDELLHLILK